MITSHRLVRAVAVALVGPTAMMPLASASQGASGVADACREDRGGYASTGDCASSVITAGKSACARAAARAGFDPSQFNLMSGTDANDTFTGTGAADLFCGFGGSDYARTLRPGDIFLGGAGDDRVESAYGGSHFAGGAGDDTVSFLFGGSFDGGAGFDSIGKWWAGPYENVESVK